MNTSETIHVDDSRVCSVTDAWGGLSRQPGRRSDVLGRMVLWHSPAALLPDAERDAGSIGRMLPTWLPLASVGAALLESDGAT